MSDVVEVTHACIMEYSLKFNAWYCVECREAVTDEHLYNAERANHAEESPGRTALPSVRSG